MTAPTHVTFGILTAILIAKTFSIIFSPVNFVFLIIGSLFPDIDGGGVITKPGSILKRFLTKPFVFILDLFGSGISKLLRKATGHRGLFHWLIWPLLIIFNANSLNTLWFGIGYFSHVFSDSLTPQGVPLLAPLTTKKINLASIRTGSKMESIVFSLCVFFSIYFSYDLLPQGVQDTFNTIRKEFENIK